MEKIIKRSIIIISLIIIIILISIVLINLNKIKEQEKQENLEVENAEKIKIQEIEVEKKIYNYLYLNSVLDKVFEYVSGTQTNVKNAEALINLLDKEYINKYNITEENVFSVLNEYKNIDSYFSKEIYKKEIAQRQNITGIYYYIKGIDRKDSQENYIYTLIKQDLQNSTYSINILTEDEFYNKEKEDKSINIEKNLYNIIYGKEVTDYQICLELLTDYINTVKNNTEKGYYLLDNEYKQKRFGNIKNYIEYINNTKQHLVSAILKEYAIQREEEFTKCICVDNRGNYYIFEVKNMMNYTLMLDTYTIDSVEFLEQYKKANSLEKAGYNIQRCIESINNKNYSYMYNKLDNQFKENNYPTLQDFEKIMKTKLFNGNKINTVSGTNEGYTYIYKLNIIDSEDSLKNINMTIIMQLKEETDFTMSFSFE